jgi:hypothetical protein
VEQEEGGAAATLLAEVRQVWDAATGKLVQGLQGLPGQQQGLQGLQGLQALQGLQGHPASGVTPPVSALAFRGEGTRLRRASGSSDATAKVAYVTSMP